MTHIHSGKFRLYVSVQRATMLRCDIYFQFMLKNLKVKLGPIPVFVSVKFLSALLTAKIIFGKMPYNFLSNLLDYSYT